MKKIFLFLLLFQNGFSFGMQEFVNDIQSSVRIGEFLGKYLRGEWTPKQKNELKRFGTFVGQCALAVGISYCGIFLNTIFHELGHALVLKYCHDVPLSIYLGVSQHANPTLGLHITGFNPSAGVTNILHNAHCITPSTAIATLIGGPLLGFCAAGAFHYILEKQNFLPKLTQKLCIKYNYRNYVWNLLQLCPGRGKSDGDRLLRIMRDDDNFEEYENSNKYKIFKTLNFSGQLFNSMILTIKLLSICYKYYPN